MLLICKSLINYQNPMQPMFSFHFPKCSSKKCLSTQSNELISDWGDWKLCIGVFTATFYITEELQHGITQVLLSWLNFVDIHCLYIEGVCSNLLWNHCIALQLSTIWMWWKYLIVTKKQYCQVSNVKTKLMWHFTKILIKW